MSGYDISIVLVGRNDDHGVNFLDRMAASMEFNRRNLLDKGVRPEFIFVDWAFDPAKPLFAQLIREKLPWWDAAIAVNHQWQDHIKKNPRLTFLEFNAKNVGVRRAKADFTLSTNCDIFFSKGLVEFLAKKQWRRDTLYRAVRVDILQATGLEEISFETLEHPSAVSRVNWAIPPLYTNASGDMQFMSRELWSKVRGFNEEVQYTKVHKDSNLMACAYRKHHIRTELAGHVYHFDHAMSLNLVQGQYGPNNELAPYGPDWDWTQPYDNDENWGLGDQPETAFSGDPTVSYIGFPPGLS